MAQDTSPEAMVRANEANLEEWWRFVMPRCGGAMHDDPDLAVFAMGIPIAYFNGVCRARLDPATAADRIAFAQDWLRQQAVPGTWVIGPSTRPDDLAERLLARGFAQAGESVGMGLDLRALKDTQPLPEGVLVERVRTGDQMRIWCETSLVGYGVPHGVLEGAIAVLSRLPPDDDAHLRCYLARLDGEPVGTSTLFLGGGVAGLYSIATLPAARNRGIGRALTVAPLQEARALGYRIAILQASAMGYPVYQRLGFAEHLRYLEYSWPPV